MPDERKIYQIQLDHDELVALTGMMLLSIGTLQRNENKQAIAIVTLITVEDGFRKMCAKAEQIAAAIDKEAVNA